MKKKVAKPVITSTEPEVQVEIVTHISPIGTDFGREDLNLMAAKVNEIIAHLNK